MTDRLRIFHFIFKFYDQSEYVDLLNFRLILFPKVEPANDFFYYLPRTGGQGRLRVRIPSILFITIFLTCMRTVPKSGFLRKS